MILHAEHEPLSVQQVGLSPIPQLVVVNMADFLSMQLPERGFLLEPVIPTQGIVILYAPRGIGKTFAALSMSLAVAGGLSLYNWRASKGNKVLYVDGEMPAIAMQERLHALACGMAAPEIAMQNLSLLTPDMQMRSMPDLATIAGQKALEPYLQAVDLLVLDNIATLCRTGKENESQSWQPMQTWLLDLRRRGIAVLLVHHAGKSGDQRGTSAREDIMDTVISLRRPKVYNMAEGARFQVHLTKARGITGKEALPFEVHLNAKDNLLHWDVFEVAEAELEQIKKLLDEGYSIRECAEELGISKSAAHRLKLKLEEMG
ncbi:MAG: AAA family ATPase [Desulfovibrionaceae bacterium]|nr:AAA family ATPase [Desulfovibrionaceae bacterium]